MAVLIPMMCMINNAVGLVAMLLLVLVPILLLVVLLLASYGRAVGSFYDTKQELFQQLVSTVGTRKCTQHGTIRHSTTQRARESV